MLEKLFYLGKGHATKVGLVGLFLTALGTACANFAASPCHDTACWLELGKSVFIAVGGFGLARKILPGIDALVEAAKSALHLNR